MATFGTSSSPDMSTITDASIGRYIELNSHTITYSNDFMEFSCTDCEMEEEVPPLFQQSTGFRAAIYQLYIISQFKNNRCNKTILQEKKKKERRTPKQFVPKPSPSTIPPSPKPGDTYYVGGENYTFYDVSGGTEYWVTDSGTDLVTTEQIIRDANTKTEAERFAKQINYNGGSSVINAIYDDKQDTFSTSTISSASGNSISKSTVDTSSSNSDDTLSAKEKFARGMLDRNI